MGLRRRLFGFDEHWRWDGTGTRAFFIMYIRVWQRDFTHSTTFSEERISPEAFGRLVAVVRASLDNEKRLAQNAGGSGAAGDVTRDGSSLPLPARTERSE